MDSLLTIRADAGPTMGIGHVMRMIALGQAWRRRGGQVAVRGDVDVLKDRILAEGFSLSLTEDNDAFLDSLCPGSWVAIDGYHFGVDFQQAVRARGVKTLVVDDVNDRGEYCADILLNQNPDGAEYDYWVNDDAKLLLGTRFILLREEFLAPGHEQVVENDEINVLVSFGGADPGNVTAEALRVLSQVNVESLRVKVVNGAAIPNAAAVTSIAESVPFRCEVLNNVTDMATVMQWAHVAVGAAGSTCWEWCLFGIPMFLVAVADNQEGVARSLEKVGAAVVVPSLDADKLEMFLTDIPLRESMSAVAGGLVDGRGADRVVNAMRAHGLHLRPFVAEDWGLLLKWRNAPEARAQSFQQGEIEPESHQQWLASKLGEQGLLFFIAELDGVPVGQVRLDWSEGEYEVSLTVAPEQTGRGIGGAMLSAACRKALAAKPHAVVAACVMEGNEASEGLFRGAGFIRIGEGSHCGRTFFRYQLRNES